MLSSRAPGVHVCPCQLPLVPSPTPATAPCPNAMPPLSTAALSTRLCPGPSPPTAPTHRPWAELCFQTSKRWVCITSKCLFAPFNLFQGSLPGSYLGLIRVYVPFDLTYCPFPYADEHGACYAGVYAWHCTGCLGYVLEGAAHGRDWQGGSSQPNGPLKSPFAPWSLPLSPAQLRPWARPRPLMQKTCSWAQAGGASRVPRSVWFFLPTCNADFHSPPAPLCRTGPLQSQLQPLWFLPTAVPFWSSVPGSPPGTYRPRRSPSRCPQYDVSEARWSPGQPIWGPT